MVSGAESGRPGYGTCSLRLQDVTGSVWRLVTIAKTMAEIRSILSDEGVFRDAATTDDSTLRVMWRVRESPEYRARLAELAAEGANAD